MYKQIWFSALLFLKVKEIEILPVIDFLYQFLDVYEVLKLWKNIYILRLSPD